MIDRAHDLPIVKAAEVLRISRGGAYDRPQPVPDADLAIMRRLDRLHLEYPFAGSRMLRGLLAAEGCKIGRRHVKTLMQRMGEKGALSPSAQQQLEDWRRYYNEERPHGAIGQKTPSTLLNRDGAASPPS
jgi:predicted transcriptional regulator